MRPIRPRHTGFTLIELITSLAVMSVLMFGMASAIMLSTRAIPTGQAPAQDVQKTATVLDEFAEDLRVAEYITKRSTNAITFTVPDRDGDGAPEVIRYAWSGVAGQPLVRFYNDTTGAEVLEDVHAFDLAFEIQSEDETYDGLFVESSELELSSFDVEWPRKEYTVEKDNWFAQHIDPTFLESVISWSVTRVLIQVKAEGPKSGDTLVQLRPPDASGLPGDTVLEQYVMDETGLTGSYTWVPFLFTSVTAMAPDQAVCLVLEWAGDDPNDKVSKLAGDDRGTGIMETDDAGASWTKTDETLQYYVYGKTVSLAGANTLIRDHVTAVRVTARAGASETSTVETSIQTLNRPETLAALWLADFECDPTELDLDLDETQDWKVPGDLPFNNGQRQNGEWLIDAGIQTNPGSNFDKPTTVDVRLRDGADDGEAGGVTLRVDRDGDTYAYIRAEVETNGSGGQRVTVSTYDPSLEYVTVLSIANLPDDWVDVRILVDPAYDRFNVRINGEERGTYSYGRVTFVNDRVIYLYETDASSGVKFDSVRVRIGGRS